MNKLVTSETGSLVSEDYELPNHTQDLRQKAVEEFRIQNKLRFNQILTQIKDNLNLLKPQFTQLLSELDKLGSIMVLRYPCSVEYHQAKNKSIEKYKLCFLEAYQNNIYNPLNLSIHNNVDRLYPLFNLKQGYHIEVPDSIFNNSYLEFGTQTIVSPYPFKFRIKHIYVKLYPNKPLPTSKCCIL